MKDLAENSQAARDADRATADLLAAQQGGADPETLAELRAVRWAAVDRVETLRHRPH